MDHADKNINVNASPSRIPSSAEVALEAFANQQEAYACTENKKLRFWLVPGSFIRNHQRMEDVFKMRGKDTTTFEHREAWQHTYYFEFARLAIYAGIAYEIGKRLIS